MIAILLLTSQQMAMARGELKTVAGEVVLCQGGVAVSVSVDQDGNPVGPAHFCPDCVSGFFVEVALFAPEFVRQERVVALGLGAEPENWNSYARGLRPARGPPFVI